MTSAFHVGPVRVDPPVVLAPMEDVTALPFRLIAKRIGKPGLMFTEFVSAMAVHYNAKKTLRKMRVHPSERPLAIQIFGPDPDVMAETARLAEEMGADIVDINMGCWVPKVCKTGSGAALLKDPDTAAAIVSSVVRAVRVPVTVKVRAGFEWSVFAAPDLARRFQDVGAQMITLHARFAKQGFEGEADWRLIEQMRSAVSVPLIGNGDVRVPDDALRMLRETGCDGVMVGRAAISNPWMLANIVSAVTDDARCAMRDTGSADTTVPRSEIRACPERSEWVPSLDERIEVALEHLRLQIAYVAEVDAFSDALKLPAKDFAEAEMYAVRSLRGQIPMYIKGEPGAAQAREKLTRCSTLAEVEDELRKFQGHLLAGTAR